MGLQAFTGLWAALLTLRKKDKPAQGKPHREISAGKSERLLTKELHGGYNLCLFVFLDFFWMLGVKQSQVMLGDMR